MSREYPLAARQRSIRLRHDTRPNPSHPSQEMDLLSIQLALIGTGAQLGVENQLLWGSAGLLDPEFDKAHDLIGHGVFTCACQVIGRRQVCKGQIMEPA